jgi:Zn-dependent M28 family amino/carboxypeptidase
MACVARSRYVADLEAIAGPREPGSPHHDEVRELCATRLTDLGYNVERFDYGTGIDIVGTLTGTSSPDERVLISAHYDGTGATCDGADDNGSGVAGLLEAARVLATIDHSRTLVVACWDEEERGLVGSRAYADRANAAGEVIVANYVFEMIGYRDPTPGAQTFPTGFDLLFPRVVRAEEALGSPGDFIALVADELHSTDAVARFETNAARVGLRTVAIVASEALKLSPATGDLRRSDHGGFWANDDPGIMVTDTANFRYDGYHCYAEPDTIDRLDHDFSVRVVQATIGAVAEIASP